MHAQPHYPPGGNWIWAGTAAFSITILAAVGMSYAGAGRCPPAAAGRSARSAPTARPDAAGGDAPRAPGVTAATAGLALYYRPGGAIGSCELGPFRHGGWYASLPPARYAAGAACGSYLLVQGPAGRVVAEVVDLCPGCRSTTVNLSVSAFSRIADLGPGSARVTFRSAVNPPLPGPLLIQAISLGARGSLALQIRNHGNPLTSVAIAFNRSAASSRPTWRRLSLRPDNFWVLASTAGAGPFDLRVIDDQGHQVVLRGLSLIPGTTARPHVWMYRARAATAGGARTNAPARPTPGATGGAHC